MKQLFLLMAVSLLTFTSYSQPSIDEYPNLQVGDIYVPFANSATTGQYLIFSEGSAVHNILLANSDSSVIDWAQIRIDLLALPQLGSVLSLVNLLDNNYIPVYVANGGWKLCCDGERDTDGDFCWAFSCHNCPCLRLPDNAGDELEIIIVH